MARRFSEFVAAGAMALSLPALAQSAPDLADLVGARAAGAETQMEARGYRVTGGSTVRDIKFTFWWNERKQSCVSVSTVEGRYASIEAVPAGNCDSSSSASPPPHAAAETGSLVLVCYGGGSKPTTSTRPNYTWNSDKHKWEWGTSIQSAQRGFSSDVQIEIYGDHGRIHLGRDLVPPIHSGGSNGWWDLDNLSVTPTLITASYRLNGMNKPKVKVDRRTGRIEIREMTSFSGQCDMGDWSQGQRRF